MKITVKIISLLLAAVLVASCLSACGSKDLSFDNIVSAFINGNESKSEEKESASLNDKEAVSSDSDEDEKEDVSFEWSETESEASADSDITVSDDEGKEDTVTENEETAAKPLDEKSCDEAFLMAKEFYKDEFEQYIPFYCNSWILYPENKNILHEKSNTYRFMSRFEIINEYADKNFDNLWRIFDTMERHPDKLPEKTLIQKAYKAHLKNGGKMGSGEGLFFVSKDK